MKKYIVAAVVAGIASTPAFAAIDVSSATTAISTDGSTALTEIGQALIGLAGLAVVFKWAKGAIFG